METSSYQNSWSTGRVDLYKIVPLEQPTSIGIWSCGLCNFRCEYCAAHSMANVRENSKAPNRIMTYETFQRTVDNIAEAGWHLKKMIFTGDGEPLLNPEIARMIAYAKSKGITDRTEIFTNGSRLTPELSEQLIEAGLDQIRISIQGLSAEQYWKTCRVKIDFEQFVQQLEYFQSHKKHTRVYLKTLDYLLPNEGDEEMFRDIFKNCSDYIAVEHLFPDGELDSSNISGLTKYGGESGSSICSMAFLNLVIWQDGGIAPCLCPADRSFQWGNVHTHSLREIWESKRRKNFLLRQLDGVENIPFCRDCRQPRYGLPDSDRLDGHEDEIRQRILESHGG